MLSARENTQKEDWNERKKQKAQPEIHWDGTGKATCKSSEKGRREFKMGMQCKHGLIENHSPKSLDSHPSEERTVSFLKSRSGRGRAGSGVRGTDDGESIEYNMDGEGDDEEESMHSGDMRD